MGESSQIRVFVVEDNEVSALLAEEVLKSAGYVVHLARSGKELQTLLDQSRPDLILMDIQLPGEDGLAITERLRADPATSEIPVVIATAYPMPGDRAQAKWMHVASYVTKPYAPLQLLQIVWEVLKARG